jgi:hypothetical protein
MSGVNKDIFVQDEVNTLDHYNGGLALKHMDGDIGKGDEALIGSGSMGLDYDYLLMEGGIGYKGALEEMNSLREVRYVGIRIGDGYCVQGKHGFEIAT